MAENGWFERALLECFVYSDEKRRRIFEILADNGPNHYQRLWLVGFLKYVGYNKNEVFEIIKKLNKWLDFRARTSFYQICSVFKENKKPIKLSVSEPQLSNKESCALSSPVELNVLPDLPYLNDDYFWDLKHRTLILKTKRGEK